MFGYVFPDKPELKIKDFALYRSVYCSLCETLRGYGPFAKGLLNYDFTFVSMLYMAVNSVEPEYCERRCNTNPLLREKQVCRNNALDYSASALLVSARHKLLDDVRDEAFFKSALARIALVALKRPFKRASDYLPEFDALASKKMSEQADSERTSNDNLDAVCAPSAELLSFLLAGISNDEKASRVLGRLGYLLGRFVYLADAADDLSDDLERGRFNPFISRFALTAQSAPESLQQARSEALSQLFHTIGQAEACYRLLDIVYFKDILDNIIYLGLRRTASSVGASKQKGRKKHEQSLSGSGN
ncbi:MAG: DUF5685 family protein [Oscillospiraceae bacterium]